jgi:Tol biopolymer transport system component
MRDGAGDPGGEGGSVYVTSARGGAVRRIGGGNAPVWSPDGRYLAWSQTHTYPLPTQLHICDLRSPARRTTIPGRLSQCGLVDQLTWLP